MTFYDRYHDLCLEVGMKPQSKEMLEIAGVSSPSVTGWKKGSQPNVDTLCRLSKYFEVTTDYMLGLSDLRKSSINTLSEYEDILIKAFRSANAEGKLRIIQVCMNERDSEKRETIIV